MLKKQIQILRNQEILKLGKSLVVAKNQPLELCLWLTDGFCVDHKISLDLSKNSYLKFFLVCQKTQEINLEINILQAEEYSSSQFFSLLWGDIKTDLNLKIKNKHTASHCTSMQLIKSLSDQDSRIQALSQVEIQKNVVKVDSSQTLKNLFLSEKSMITALPELKIASQDVTARHGFSTTKISSQDYFFLNTRGLNKQQAKELLIQTFSKEILNKIEPICQKKQIK